jgi:hypothetical protein
LEKERPEKEISWGVLFWSGGIKDFILGVG